MTATTTTIPITVPTSPVTTANFNPAVLANTTWILKSYGDAANMTPVLTYPRNVTLTFNNTVDGWYGDDSVMITAEHAISRTTALQRPK